jgi:murein DD-endopeptidase MepM/ murein hydrolase activator NlpD
MFKPSKALAILIPLSFLIFFTAAQTLDFSLDQVFPAGQTAAVPASEKAGPAQQTAKPAPVLYGIATDSLEIVTGEVARGQSLSDILTAYNISATTMHYLEQKARETFSVRRINAHRNYVLLHARDSARTAQYFIYEPNDVEYVIYDLRGELNVRRLRREITTVERVLSGEIEGSVYESVLKAGGSAQLVNTLADIYAWRLNLNLVQPGDTFKLLFEEKQVNGQTIGYGQLKAAYFEHEGEPLYAIAFDQGKGTSYYDQEGKSFKKAFLKEPLEYTRISSRFSKNRFHPVQRRYKAHLGTDFAAPRGTPIRSVGEGVVLEAAYSRGNGYFVKIRHNRQYTTQYLHLSRFAKNLRRGARISQGQTIGYVGSTGLSTGPHLCYRLWKNGRQVDALTARLPSAEPVLKKNKEAFSAAREAILKKLQLLPAEASPQQLIASDKNKADQGA